MVIASGANVITRYKEEATRGTQETGTAAELRVTQTALNLSKNLLTSAELRSSGLIADERHGFRSIGGALGAQLSYGDLDALLAIGLRNSWATAPTLTAPTSLAITAGTSGAPSTITGVGSQFQTDGFTAGDLILTSNFTTAANNGYFIIAEVTSETVLTVYDGANTMVTEGADTDATFVAFDRLDYGNTMTTWTVEREFSDLTGAGNRYQVFTGVGVQSLQISVSPESIVSVAAQMLGIGGGTFSGSSTFSGSTSPSSNNVFAAFNGAVTIDETQQTAITAFDLTANNNRTTEAVVGAFTSPDLFEGTASTTGNLTAFLENDSPLYDAFVNETEKRFFIEFGEPNNGTNKMWLFAPRLKINGGELDPPQSGPVPSSATISALEDATIGTSLILYRT